MILKSSSDDFFIFLYNKEETQNLYDCENFFNCEKKVKFMSVFCVVFIETGHSNV